MTVVMITAPGKTKIVLGGNAQTIVNDIDYLCIIGSDLPEALTVTGILRGDVSLAGGNDTVTITTGLGSAGDLITLDTGAGADSLTFRGYGAGSAVIDLGTGSDSLRVSGIRSAEINAGDGTDTLSVALDGTYILRGGAGDDGLILDAAVRNVIFDRAANGAALIRLASNLAVWVQVEGFERIRFSDGTLLTANQLEARLPLLEARESGAVQNTITGTAAAEGLMGTAQNDIFYGGGGLDTLTGGSGDDRYQVNGSETIVELPNGGVDTAMYALNETYVLPTNVENLVLQSDALRAPWGAFDSFSGITSGASGIGNASPNWIRGGAAPNTLDGRGGNDVLTGGGGADIFVFGLGYGHDRVADFTPGLDRIRLVSGPLDWATVSASMTDTAAGVVLTLESGETLTLAGVTKAQLSAHDFEFRVDLSAYRLTFSDEFDVLSRFDGTGEDGGTWRARILGSDGSAYSRDVGVSVENPASGLDPFSVSDGILTVTASWQPDLASAYSGKSYLTGSLSTRGTFAQQYGYFEVRMKMSAQAGGFPAFWLLPTDGSWPPEIDIMEQIGRQAGVIYQMGNVVQVDTTQWHAYGLEWTETRLSWYVDGELTYSFDTTAFNTPMYVLLDYALGGSWAGSVPQPAAAGATLGNIQIDYVRVYELVDGAAARATIPEEAPRVTFSLGSITPGGTPASADSWSHLADTTGWLAIMPADFGFASLNTWFSAVISNDRQADSYTAQIDNGWANANVQVRDSDGGSFSFDDLVMAELRLGGTKASTVSLSGIQFGLVETAAGNDAVTISGHRMWNWGRSTSFEVSTGAGHDTITGWTGASGRLVAYAGAGSDVVIGSGGSDLLDGGTGNDRLSGVNGGADVFQFVRGEDGFDQIFGFARDDALQFSGFTRSEMTMVDANAGVLIYLPGQTVQVVGWQAVDLGDWAFRFV